MKILIIDDSKSSRMLLENFLFNFGYKNVHLTSSFKEARAFLEENDDVDLILMDILMPVIDGIEATRILKADSKFVNIPIISVSASDTIDSLDKAFEAGAIDYINKPINKVELRARVRSVLRLKQERDTRIKREKELEELTKKYKLMSGIDGLTGIPNRRSFDEQLAEEWSRANREKWAISLLMIDIDFFKKYNDYYGHVQGDNCLKEVSRIINTKLKRPGDMLARYGGEEFVIILPNTDSKGAALMGENIRAAVESMQLEHKKSGVSDYITVSIGAASGIPTSNLTPQDLIKAADKALYCAKEDSRNCVKVDNTINIIKAS